MKCPSCEHIYELEWLEYFKEPLGHHTCPTCNYRFRLRYSFTYLLLTTLGCLIGGIPVALLVFYFYGYSWQVIVGWIIGASISGLPIDKIIDNRFRESIKHKENNL